MSTGVQAKALNVHVGCSLVGRVFRSGVRRRHLILGNSVSVGWFAGRRVEDSIRGAVEKPYINRPAGPIGIVVRAVEEYC